MVFMRRNDIMHCVNCGYSLRGATALSCRCPECGMPYDENTIAWHQSAPTLADRIKHTWPFVVLLGLALITRNWAGRIGALTVVVGMASTGPLKRPWRFLARSGDPAFVALCPDGVVLGRTGREHTSHTVSWSEVTTSRARGSKAPSTADLIVEHLRDFANVVDVDVVRRKLDVWLRPQERVKGSEDSRGGRTPSPNS